MKIKELYKSMKKDFLGENAKSIPEEFWSQFVCVGGASEMQHQIGQVIPEKPKRKILILGISGGKEYFYLRLQGHEIFALDLFDDKRFNNLIIGDVQNKFPWPDGYFDAVVAGEVIEHVPKDFEALSNINRVLKNDGIFIITVPLFGDIETTHIHIYSRATIERLLNASGFKVEKVFERPNLFLFPTMINLIHHAANAFFYLIFKRTVYRYTLPILWRAEYYLSKKNIFLRRFSRKYGVTLICGKGKIIDFVEINKEKFS